VQIAGRNDSLEFRPSQRIATRASSGSSIMMATMRCHLCSLLRCLTSNSTNLLAMATGNACSCPGCFCCFLLQNACTCRIDCHSDSSPEERFFAMLCLIPFVSKLATTNNSCTCHAYYSDHSSLSEADHHADILHRPGPQAQDFSSQEKHNECRRNTYRDNDNHNYCWGRNNKNSRHQTLSFSPQGSTRGSHTR
jgi:hypothetical protein